MVQFNNHFQQQADGTNVTVANSTTYGDSPLGAVYNTNGTVTYSRDTASHGLSSVKLTSTAGATTGVIGVEVGGTLNSTTVGCRGYFQLGSIPTSPTRIISLRSSSTGDLGGLNVTAAGTVATTDVQGAYLNQSSTTTQVLSINTWYRMEFLWKLSATAGSYKAAVYVGDSATAWYSYSSATNLNSLVANGVGVAFGKMSSAGALTAPWYLDDLEVTDSIASFLGPYVPTGPSISTTTTPGFAKLDATGSAPVNGGALSYSLSPTSGWFQSSPGVFFIPEASSATNYALTVKEAGGGTTTTNVTVPALSSSVSAQTTVTTQRFIGGSWQ